MLWLHGPHCVATKVSLEEAEGRRVVERNSHHPDHSKGESAWKSVHVGDFNR